jgi:hypothetical protein
MRRILICLIFITISISAEQIYYNSNKSLMLLDPIEVNSTGDYFVIRDEHSDTFSYIYTFYKEGEEVRIREEFYLDDFLKIKKIIISENGTKTVEHYTSDLLSEVETFDSVGLLSRETFTYNNKRELINVESRNSEEKLIYEEVFYRNSDGALRKLIHKSDDGYYNHWFYKDGVIVESWLIEGDDSTRSTYDLDGKIQNVTQFDKSGSISSEEYTYNNKGILLSSIKILGERSDNKNYDESGNLIEHRVLENDILTKKNVYEYDGDLLIKEFVTGHGKREEYLFQYDEDDEISTTFYYVNGEIKRINSIVDEDSEVVEYYKNNVIYLKEYFLLGERIQRDLYLDGELFKSESNNE